MLENPMWLKEALEDLRRKATDWPPEKFLEHVDKMVENSRMHLESSEDEHIRSLLLALYQCIFRYAFACQVRALSNSDPCLTRSYMSASC